VQVGPDCTCVKSRILTPSSAQPACPHGFVVGRGRLLLIAFAAGFAVDFLGLNLKTFVADFLATGLDFDFFCVAIFGSLRLMSTGNGSALFLRPNCNARSQPFAISRCRSGLSTNRARPTTTKFMIAVNTNTKCQPPVADLIRLATGTRKADAPLAV
jgi:hypothetical protein